jgi:hypothetical protein
MTDSPPTPLPRRRPWHHVPLLGWLLWDLQRDFAGNWPYAAVIALTLMIFAVDAIGLAAIGLLAVALTPLMVLTLVLISRG